jgi:hypothetical protein
MFFTCTCGRCIYPKRSGLIPCDASNSASTCHRDINAFAASGSRTYIHFRQVIADCLSVGPFQRSNPMSTETASPRRTCRVIALALLGVLSLSAVTSANASPRAFHASPAARSYYSPSFRAPPPPARSYYSPSTSMIAQPMQQAPAIAPLSPHVNSGF